MKKLLEKYSFCNRFSLSGHREFYKLSDDEADKIIKLTKQLNREECKKIWENINNKDESLSFEQVMQDIETEISTFGRDYIEYEIIGKLNDEHLAEAIVSRLKIEDVSNIPIFFKNMEGEELERCIQEIKSIQGINKNQVARVTRLGRKRVDKFWDKIEPALNVPKGQNRTGTECTKCI